MRASATAIPLDRRSLVEAFSVFNLAALGLDIYVAHSANDFALSTEWIPLFFSAVATLLLLPALLFVRLRLHAQHWIGFLVGTGSIAVGILGMFLHLASTFFAEQTLKQLVYTAPFAAPLAYAGVGFLLILNRMEPESSSDWGAWIIFLAMAGFVGLFAIALGDHAQNGFFEAAEWISVVAAAFAASFLLTAIIRRPDRRFIEVCMVLMGVQALVGGLGFVLHSSTTLGGTSESLWDNLVFGAPVFAPLLFANLAMLGSIGLWDVRSRTHKLV